MEIPRRRGGSKAQFFEGKYDTKMEFLDGWGEGYGYLLEQHIVHILTSEDVGL